MSVSAQYVGPWEVVDMDTVDVLEKKITGSVFELYASTHHIIQLKRNLVLIGQFTPETGSTKATFTALQMGNGATMGFSSTGKKYRCTKDNIKVTDQITGAAEQTQTWEYLSEPEQIAYSEFAGAS